MEAVCASLKALISQTSSPAGEEEYRIAGSPLLKEGMKGEREKSRLH
jgi:hypothetical protein